MRFQQRSMREQSVLLLFIGRWWRTDLKSRTQVVIDLIAMEGNGHLIGERKWRNEPLDLAVQKPLKTKADIFSMKREHA